MPVFIYRCLKGWISNISWPMGLHLLRLTQSLQDWSIEQHQAAWLTTYCRILRNRCQECLTIALQFEKVSIYFSEYLLFGDDRVLGNPKMEMALILLHDSCFVALKLLESVINFPVMSVSWMKECLVDLLSVEIMVRSYVCVMKHDERLIFRLCLSKMHQLNCHLWLVPKCLALFKLVHQGPWILTCIECHFVMLLNLRGCHLQGCQYSSYVGCGVDLKL